MTCINQRKEEKQYGEIRYASNLKDDGKLTTDEAATKVDALETVFLSIHVSVEQFGYWIVNQNKLHLFI